MLKPLVLGASLGAILVGLFLPGRVAARVSMGSEGSSQADCLQGGRFHPFVEQAPNGSLFVFTMRSKPDGTPHFFQ